MSDLVQRAFEFACKAHEGQARKYTGEPYVHHCVEVAMTVSLVSGHDEAMVAAALLHDTIEDTPTTYEDIFVGFGYTVARYVDWLSDPVVEGNRATRKAAARDKIAKAPAKAQTIKLADLISNTQSIVQYDPHFSKVYLAEKRLLLGILTKGDPDLHRIATELANQ